MKRSFSSSTLNMNNVVEVDWLVSVVECDCEGCDVVVDTETFGTEFGCEVLSIESAAVVSSVVFERVCDDTTLLPVLSSLVFGVEEEVGTTEVEEGETLKEGSTYPLYQCCVA
jgi:hypothetical protein